MYGEKKAIIKASTPGSVFSIFKITAVFTIAKTWKQHRGSARNKWINK